MKTFSEISQIINTYHELGETIAAADFLVDTYQIRHPNFEGFVLREKAQPEYILMTTEGTFGKKQLIRIPENTFEFPLILMLNLIAHEMIHVAQKQVVNQYPDRNEREWQAYYEMLFHKVYPQVPQASVYHQRFFAGKAFEYYKRMGENSALQRQYAAQKKEVEQLLATLT